MMAALPIIASVGSSALSYFGQTSANEANRRIAEQTNAANERIAKQNRDFQERMSSTAYQRAVDDMRKAGINPILAAQQGGASSPAGSAVGAVTGAPMQNTLSGAAHSAKDLVMLASTLANLDADTKVKQATAANINAQIPGNAAVSRFDANKYGVVNDVIDVLKGSVRYNQNVNSAKTAAPSFFGNVSTRVQDYAHSAKKQLQSFGSYMHNYRTRSY